MFTFYSDLFFWYVLFVFIHVQWYILWLLQVKHKVCYKPFFCVQLNGRGVGKIIALGAVAMDAVSVTGTETSEIVVVCAPGVSICVVVVVSVTGTGACVVVVASVTGTIVCAIVVVSVDGTGVGVMVVIFETVTIPVEIVVACVTGTGFVVGATGGKVLCWVELVVDVWLVNVVASVVGTIVDIPWVVAELVGGAAVDGGRKVVH